MHDRRIEQRGEHGEFLWPIGLATPIVRAPSPKDGDEVRTIDHIAPEEIAEAAFLCVQEARSLTEADLIRETAKLLGYARVTKKIDAAMTNAIRDVEDRWTHSPRKRGWCAWRKTPHPQHCRLKSERHLRPLLS